MQANFPLKNWIPYRLDFRAAELTCEYLFVGEKAFVEPFFHETSGKCRGLAENRKPFKVKSSLETLIEISKEVPCVEPTAFIFHISRCGSTLLAQLLCLEEENIVLSEVPILDEVLRDLYFKREDISAEKRKEALRAVIKILGQKRTGKEQNLFIKLDSWDIFYYELLRELYPDTPFIFSYRRPNEVIRSQLKDAGMHAAPGVIEPALFGWTLEEILPLQRAVYVAKVLEKYLENYLKILDEDKNSLFLDYKEGAKNALEQLLGFVGLSLSEEFLQKVEHRLTFHSKRPNQSFEEPPLEEEIPVFQFKVMDLYEKLRAASR